ncbi:MAG: hypothetical protein ABIG95_04100 [Candidatus Woesearchaeota archaeon]
MAELVEKLEEILFGIEDARAQEALDYVSKCFDPATPSYEISTMGLTSVVLSLLPTLPPEKHKQLFALQQECLQYLHNLGYRENIYTQQERLLLEKLPLGPYDAHPYTPRGIVNDEMTIEEAVKARQLARRFFVTNPGFFLNSSASGVWVNLEKLDEEGNTVRDPRLVDLDLNPVPTDYSKEFPYRRKRQVIQKQ